MQHLDAFEVLPKEKPILPVKNHNVYPLKNLKEPILYIQINKHFLDKQDQIGELPFNNLGEKKYQPNNYKSQTGDSSINSLLQC
jgi:hypothetical protein